MKVNQQLIKQYREQRLWSQEQLAITANLGLRTVQRIESTGTASFESIAAIASALEVPSNILIVKDSYGKVYKHTQIGFAIIVIFTLVFSLQISTVFNSVESLSKAG
jgi:transcriptional regulator with XRE-family HTH domain